MTQMTQRTALIGDNYQILPFAKLPEAHQLAMAWYMAVNGEAWSGVELPDMMADQEGFMPAFKALIPQFVEKYGTTPFGMTTVNADQIKRAVMTNPDIAADFKNFAEYHEWYLSHNDTPSHSDHNQWPVILGSDDDEVLQDGWHRLHSYLRSGLTEIPMIFYPDRKHLWELITDDMTKGATA